MYAFRPSARTLALHTMSAVDSIFGEETVMPFRSILRASAPLAFLCALLVSTTAHAGCEITIEIKNDHDDMVTVNWWHSEVKIKNGFWKDLSKDLTGTKIQDSMEPGALVSRVYGADFGCDKQRQYRFEVFTAESRYWIETFPRDTDFTTKTQFTVHLKP